MAVYTKVTKDDKVQYQLDGQDVNGAKVPLEVRNALNTVDEGVGVDETGKPANSEGEDEAQSEATNSEKTKTANRSSANDKPADDEEEGPDDEDLSDDDDTSEEDDTEEGNGEETEDEIKTRHRKEQAELDEQNAEHLRQTEEQNQRDLRQPENSRTPQDEAGMGFKRGKGKTLSIFSNKPHQTVKNVGGIMVPLTYEEYDTKTDGEILAKLKDLDKL